MATSSFLRPALRVLRRVDDAVARGEAALTVAVLLSLVLIAAAQAFLRNLTLWDVGWANQVLERLSWGDSIMQKATLWLAFLGASLATHAKKHIGIDVASRIAPPRIRSFLEALVWMAAAVTCLYLSHVFFLSIVNNAADLPFDYQAMNELGTSIHRCDASPALLATSELTRPSVFCAVRGVLSLFGARVSTPDNALQIIVPVMLVIMSVRFAGYAVFAALESVGVMGLEDPRVAEETERISVGFEAIEAQASGGADAGPPPADRPAEPSGRDEKGER